MSELRRTLEDIHLLGLHIQQHAARAQWREDQGADPAPLIERLREDVAQIETLLDGVTEEAGA